MREIKFRAWHKNIKSMCQNIGTDLLDRDYLVFMQYTGLKDENGKEIYEGDIVEIEDSVCKIIFELGTYMTLGIDKEFFGEKVPLYDLQKDDYTYKVIGNIYENPHLSR